MRARGRLHETRRQPRLQLRLLLEQKHPNVIISVNPGITLITAIMIPVSVYTMLCLVNMLPLFVFIMLSLVIMILALVFTMLCLVIMIPAMYHNH